jgi:CRP/FNR family transcriptional regulator, cyclic AMP receptor protein
MEARMASTASLDVHNDCSCCLVRSGGFCNVAPAALDAVNAAKLTAVHPKASPLFTEGEMPRAVFILCGGRAKVTSSSAEGKTLIMRIAAPGEVLGVSATILGKPYEVTAETLDPAQVSTIKRADFLRLLQSHADLCMNAVQQLSARYHDAQREIRSLGLAHNTAEKLARLLLDWCASTGRPMADGIHVRVPYTHEEIAQMIGSTRETITRVLSDFRRGNVIEANGVGLIVRDRRALETMICT